MRETGRRLVAPIMVVAGSLLAVVGLAGVKWYVWDIVISQAGQPDRSMLFWGLAVLFLALGAAGAGGLLVWAGRNLIRVGPESPRDAETEASK